MQANLTRHGFHCQQKKKPACRTSKLFFLKTCLGKQLTLLKIRSAVVKLTNYLRVSKSCISYLSWHCPGIVLESNSRLVDSTFSLFT